MPVVAMKHEEDPRDKIFRKAGNLDNIEVFNAQVLVAVYVRPARTVGGIILTAQTTDEDFYQSKVGLILKKGPSAFKDESGEWFKNETFNIGDWVVLRPSDGWSMVKPIMGGHAEETDYQSKALLLRIFRDIDVRMRIQHPDAIY
jgi:hypothetical protein